LREAVAKRWLDRASAPLLEITEATGPAPERLERWLRTMFAIKHKRFGDDPEMFATYLTLAQEACKVVKGHKDCLVDQIAAMIEDGVKQGVFDVADPRIAARTIFDATSRFHHPAHARRPADAAASGTGSAEAALIARPP